jgi:TolA-binding protein
VTSNGRANERRSPDQVLGGLIQLAQEAATDQMSVREQTGVDRLERTLAREQILGRGWFAPRSRRSRATFTLTLAAAGAAAAVLALALNREPDETLTFEVLNSQSGRDAARAAGAAGAARKGAQGLDRDIDGATPGTKLRFSDGSEVALEKDASARVASLEARGGRVLLQRGSLRARINPVTRARWTIVAGPYSVHVTGTEFSVRWSESDQVFDLGLHKGSVVVEGPLAGEGIVVSPGRRLVARLKEARLVLGRVDEAEPVAAGEPSKPPSEEPQEQAETQAEAEERAAAVASRNVSRAEARARRAGGNRPATPALSDTSWAQRLEQGDVWGILDDADRRGIARVMASAPRAELAALAHAARYGRQNHLARRALRVMRERFPQSRDAREATFFLGGLAEAGAGREAQESARDWYDRYLAESPSGSFAPVALGRKMVIVHKLRGSEAAAPVAAEYLRRYPDGTHARAARKILESR